MGSMSTAYNRSYRAKHRKSLSLRDRKRYLRTSSVVKRRQMRKYWVLVSTPRGRMRHILAGAKVRARRLGVEFSISVEDLLPLPEFCPVLGIRLNYGSCRREKGYHYDSASVDRVDPAKGYTPSNVWVVSSRANTVKNDGTAAEHRLIANAMEERLRSFVDTKTQSPPT